MTHHPLHGAFPVRGQHRFRIQAVARAVDEIVVALGGVPVPYRRPPDTRRPDARPGLPRCGLNDPAHADRPTPPPRIPAGPIPLRPAPPPRPKDAAWPRAPHSPPFSDESPPPAGRHKCP